MSLKKRLGGKILRGDNWLELIFVSKSLTLRFGQL